MSTITAGLRAILETQRASEKAASSERDGRRLTLTPASQIQIRPVHWLWHSRLALGTLALLGGREGIGKSIAIYHLGGLLTRGRLAGRFLGTPKAIIVAATEDSWAHTIVPRLMAADADLDRVYRVDVTTSEGIDSTLVLPRDLNRLHQLIAEVDAAAVILDPLMSRVDSTLDTHKDADVRRALEPVVSLAAHSNCCVLGLIHVNKSASNDALTTLMGSRAFTAVARSVLFVMADPEDETKRLLGQAKNNLGRSDLPTLAFQIVETKVADTDDGPVTTGRLEWLGETDRSIKDVLVAAAESAGDKTATNEAADWLHDYLISQGEPADSALVRREATKAGHSKDALYRAKKKLKVISASSGFPRKACWSLPASSPVFAAVGESANTKNNENTANTEGLQYSQCSQYSQSSQAPEDETNTDEVFEV